MRNIENRGYYATSVYRRISILATFYKYCVGEEEAERDPTINVKRPVLPRESTRTWLTRRELADLVSTAEKRGGYPYALILLLAFNGLRINEVVQADIEDMGREKHHITLKIMGKGYQPSIIALPQRTVLALEQAHDGRTYGPLLLNRAGTRMQRDAAGRIINRLTVQAGIPKRISPHSLRHSAVTSLLESGQDIRAAQDFARHADVRSTTIYDRRRRRLDAAGSYVLANWIAEVER
jgi:site-specific recombinase XerD